MLRQRVSQQALADRLGLSQSAISKRLSGHTPIDVNELQQIAELLDTDLCDLLKDAA